MVDELISRLSGEFIQLDLRWFSGCARGAYSFRISRIKGHARAFDVIATASHIDAIRERRRAG